MAHNLINFAAAVAVLRLPPVVSLRPAGCCLVTKLAGAPLNETSKKTNPLLKTKTGRLSKRIILTQIKVHLHRLFLSQQELITVRNSLPGDDLGERQGAIAIDEATEMVGFLQSIAIFSDGRR